MAKKIKELEDEISQLISEKDKYLNIAQRAQADLVNFRKKSSQDLIESEERSYRKIFHQLILVLDQFTIAMSAKVIQRTPMKRKLESRQSRTSVFSVSANPSLGRR